MRILLALDTSTQSTAMAFSLAKACQAELTVLFVLDATWNVYVGHDWLSGSGSRADFLDWIKDEEVKAAEAAFAGVRSLAQSFPFLEKTRAGNVREEIFQEAKLGYDLLILSNPFDRGLEIMRNTAVEIAKSNPCSVLFVRRET